MLITITELNQMKKLSTISILSMCAMQNSLNEKIIPGWIETNTPYLRAAHVELTEGFNHYGWAWWKATTPDMVGYKGELIDVYHFILSAFLIRYRHMNKAQLTSKLDEILNKLSASHREFKDDVLLNVELLIGLCVKGVWSDKILTHILMLCYDAGMDSAELTTLYMSKNILNGFRKENGYKAGTYIKIWNGVEDNEYVTNYFRNSIAESDSFLNLMANDYDAFVAKVMSDLKAYYVTIAAVSKGDNAAAYRGDHVEVVCLANNPDFSQSR